MRWIHSRPGSSILFHFLRDRRKAVLCAMTLDFASNIGTIIISLLLAQMLAAFSGFQSMRAARIGWVLSTEYLLSIFVFVLILKLLIDYIRLRIRGILSEDFAAWLRKKTMYQYTKSGGVRGRLRLSSDMAPAKRLLGRGVLQMGADLGLILLSLIFLFWLHPCVAIAGFGVIFLGSMLLRRINRLVKKIEQEKRRHKTQFLNLVDTFPRKILVADGFNWHDMEKKFMRKTEMLYDLGVRYHGRAAWSEALPVFLSQLILLSVLLTGWYIGLPAETLFLTVLILMSWRNPLSRLFKADLIWKKGLLSLEKLQYADEISDTVAKKVIEVR